MVHKQAGMGVPLKDLRARPVYSTLMSSVNSLAIWAGVMYIIYLFNGFGKTGIDFYLPAILFTLFCLMYILLYKRRNYRFVAEDGLYFVRRGKAMHISWERITRVSVLDSRLLNRMQVELMPCALEEYPPLDEKELCFRYDLKAIECMRRHVLVEDLKSAGE